MVFQRLHKSMKQEVKEGITEQKDFDNWAEHYFDSKPKVRSKIIVKKKENVEELTIASP